MTEDHTINRKTFEPGDVIFNEGDLAESIYSIISGTVEIRTKSWGESFRPLAQLGKGDVFGEMALIEGRPRQAAAVALENLVVVEIDRKEFYSRLLSLDPLMKKVVIHLAVNLHETSDKLRKCEES